MMNEKRWEILNKEFANVKNFDGDGWYIANGGYPGFDLMDWLECDSRSPSGEMIDIFKEHGYKVYPGDHDSFGWLIGVVEQKETGRKITFG